MKCANLFLWDLGLGSSHIGVYIVFKYLYYQDEHYDLSYESNAISTFLSPVNQQAILNLQASR